MPSGRWLSRFKRVGGGSRQIRTLITLRRDDEAQTGYKVVDSMLPGKSSYTFRLVTVP